MRPLLSKICATYASQLHTYVLYCKATHLLNVALDIEAKDSAAIKAMKQAMTANLGERYSSPQSDELLGIACFLDPRFKAMLAFCLCYLYNLQCDVNLI